MAEASVSSHTVTGKLKEESTKETDKEQKLFTTIRVEDPGLVRDLTQHGVTVTGRN